MTTHKIDLLARIGELEAALLAAEHHGTSGLAVELVQAERRVKELEKERDEAQGVLASIADQVNTICRDEGMEETREYLTLALRDHLKGLGYRLAKQRMRIAELERLRDEYLEHPWDETIKKLAALEAEAGKATQEGTGRYWMDVCGDAENRAEEAEHRAEKAEAELDEALKAEDELNGLNRNLSAEVARLREALEFVRDHCTLYGRGDAAREMIDAALAGKEADGE